MLNETWNRSRRIRHIFYCWLAIVGLAACNLPAVSMGEREATFTATDSDQVELSQQEQALREGQCPVNEMYDLIYDHEVLLIAREAGEEQVHLEWNEEEGSAFRVWFGATGKVTNEGLDNQVFINLSGWAKGDADCPVNYIQGEWPLTAQITGTCRKGKVSLDIVEQFQANTMKGSCADIPFTGPGVYSAPELELSFDLSDPMTNDGLIYGSRDGPLYLFYWYELKPSETYLEPVPLVP